jgi:hypothetical protein
MTTQLSSYSRTASSVPILWNISINLPSNFMTSYAWIVRQRCPSSGISAGWQGRLPTQTLMPIPGATRVRLGGGPNKCECNAQCRVCYVKLVAEREKDPSEIWQMAGQKQKKHRLSKVAERRWPKVGDHASERVVSRSQSLRLAIWILSARCLLSKTQVVCLWTYPRRPRALLKLPRHVKLTRVHEVWQICAKLGSGGTATFCHLAPSQPAATLPFAATRIHPRQRRRNECQRVPCHPVGRRH